MRDEKLQHNIYGEAAKISALSSGKAHKYEYLTSEDILPSNPIYYHMRWYHKTSDN